MRITMTDWIHQVVEGYITEGCIKTNKRKVR